MAAVAPAVDAAIQAFLGLPAAIAAIYNAVGDRRIAKSDFGFAIVDWMSYMVALEPYVSRGLKYHTIELQARRILDLCSWLGYWLYTIGFRQSRAVAKKWSITGLQFPYLWLDKKCKHFEIKLELIKSEGEKLKQSVAAYDNMQPHISLAQHPEEGKNWHITSGGISTPPPERVRMIDESVNRLNMVSTRLLK